VILWPVDAEQRALDLGDTREVATIRAADVRARTTAAGTAKARPQQDLAADEASPAVERVRRLVEGVLDESQRHHAGSVCATADLVHQGATRSDTLERRRDRDGTGTGGPPADVQEAAAGHLARDGHDDTAARIEVPVGVRDHGADAAIGHDRPEAAPLVDLVESVAEDLGHARHVPGGHVPHRDLPRPRWSPPAHGAPHSTGAGGGGRRLASPRWLWKCRLCRQRVTDA